MNEIKNKKESSINNIYNLLEYDDKECSVCLDTLKYEVCILTCKHSFHYDCLSKWIVTCKAKNKEITCPLCKQEFEICTVYSIKKNNKFKCKKISAKNIKAKPNNNCCLM